MKLYVVTNVSMWPGLCRPARVKVILYTLYGRDLIDILIWFPIAV
jgi:hypothetical protein